MLEVVSLMSLTGKGLASGRHIDPETSKQILHYKSPFHATSYEFRLQDIIQFYSPVILRPYDSKYSF